MKFPPPLLEKIRYQNFFETQKGSPTKFIGTLRQRFFNGVYWYPLLMHKFRRYTKFSETPKCSLTKTIGSLWHNVFDEETWYHPPSRWCKKLFDIRNLLIHRSVPKRSLPIQWETEFRTKCLYCIKYWNQLWNWCL